MNIAFSSPLYPFASRFHAIGQHRMHYVDEGQGEPIVMLHGNPTWSFYYRRLIEEFRKTHRVIVPDHLGMGLSDKPQKYPYTLTTHIDNLDSLLDATAGCRLKAVGEPFGADSRQPAAQKLTLVLHDWGGAIGLGYAVRHPERIGRIVVLNTAAFLSDRIPLRINLCRVPGIGDLAVRGLNAFARAALSMAVAKPERLTPDVRAAYLAPYDTWENRIGLLRFVQDIPRHPGVPSYRVVQEIQGYLEEMRHLPLLIQWGAQDWCFDRGFYEEWRRRFPQAQADLYEDAGHYVLEDAHERIIPRMQEFLR